MDTQQRINLGQAKNQAIEMLKRKAYLFDDEVETAYKKLTKKFYEWNKQIDDEILGQDSTAETELNPKSAGMIKVLSPKQKLCPKCSEPIPKTWLNHGVCGWKQ